jgi:ribokinase
MGRILCVGSINADYIYRVPHLPAPGETLNAASMTRMLGGKGANQSIAASLSGADVAHLGAIGVGDDWLIAALKGRGVDTQAVAMIDMPTGHAIINVDDAGENAIVLFPSANHSVPSHMLSDKISGYGVGDICLLQNEITISAEAAEQAKSAGMTVVYSAAPFSPDAVKEILPLADLLVMNEIEARDLSKSLSMDPSDLPCDVLVTRGADGAAYYGNQKINAGAFKVTAIDTTGAGDCYIGAFSAKRANGACVEEALRWAAAASAIQVSRPGTADAMPTKAEIEAFLKDCDQ